MKVMISNACVACASQSLVPELQHLQKWCSQASWSRQCRIFVLQLR